MERDVHVTLVLEVEKHECLYNTNLPEYARKEETEKAWLEISKNIQLPVPECKEKWRNIRSTFRRSFKPSRNSKPKRTYYLSRYLNFIVPYSKPMDDIIFHEESIDQDEEKTVIVKDEGSENSVQDDEECPTSSQTSWQDCQEEKSSNDTLNNTVLHSTNQTLPSEEDFTIPEHLKRPQETDLFRGQEHMRYFFLSLLPEFSNMTEQQTRNFKIKVLQLIDDIKTGKKDSTKK